MSCHKNENKLKMSFRYHILFISSADMLHITINAFYITFFVHFVVIALFCFICPSGNSPNKTLNGWQLLKLFLNKLDKIEARTMLNVKFYL